jgi:hypothetical protein
MSNGLFQHLPGSNEMAGHFALPNEPWLLPISDKETASDRSDDELLAAVKRASRPFWLAANGLCVALGLALMLQASTGWMAPIHTGTVSVAQASPPTIAPQQASLQR